MPGRWSRQMVVATAWMGHSCQTGGVGGDGMEAWVEQSCQTGGAGRQGLPSIGQAAPCVPAQCRRPPGCSHGRPGGEWRGSRTPSHGGAGKQAGASLPIYREESTQHIRSVASSSICTSTALHITCTGCCAPMLAQPPHLVHEGRLLALSQHEQQRKAARCEQLSRALALLCKWKQ